MGSVGKLVSDIEDISDYHPLKNLLVTQIKTNVAERVLVRNNPKNSSQSLFLDFVIAK